MATLEPQKYVIARTVWTENILLVSGRLGSWRFFRLRKNARILQWPFFLQTTDLTLIGPLFTETAKRTQAKSGQGKVSAKGPPSIFLIFCNKLDFQKSPKPSYIVKNFIFLSLRYGADYRRSRVVFLIIRVHLSIIRVLKILNKTKVLLLSFFRTLDFKKFLNFVFVSSN